MQRYDAIVIGGGLVGSAIAYGLAREGLRTALLDEGDVGVDGGSCVVARLPKHRDPEIQYFLIVLDEKYIRTAHGPPTHSEVLAHIFPSSKKTRAPSK